MLASASTGRRNKLDVAKFKEDLVCALGRPEEWVRMSTDGEWLLHSSTGIKVYAHGQTYRSGTTTSPYHLICTVSQRATTRCWSAVSKREAEVRRKNEKRDRQAFLDSFPGFRS